MSEKGEKSKKQRLWLIVIIGVAAGLILLIWSSSASGEENVDGAISPAGEIKEYCAYLEDQAKRLCGSVRGVSDVTVTVTLEGGFEQVYATDRMTSTNSQSVEYVKVGSGSSARLCAVSVSTPTVAGIGVTCKGGDDAGIRAELTALLAAAFGIGSNKIYITEAG